MPSVFEGFVGFVIAASDGEVGPLGTGLDGTPGSEGLAASVTGSESSCPKLPPSDGTPGSEPGTALEGLEGNPSDGLEGLCAFDGSEALLALDGLSGIVGLLGSPGSEGANVLPSRPDSVLLYDDGKFPLCPVVVAYRISSYVSGISPSPAC